MIRWIIPVARKNYNVASSLPEPVIGRELVI
jgi:hypothetical protein